LTVYQDKHLAVPRSGPGLERPVVCLSPDLQDVVRRRDMPVRTVPAWYGVKAIACLDHCGRIPQAKWRLAYEPPG
jgi:hypothetical protein